MAFEAQRLITMSMGKIHAARSQRGGINLHKNLLVATVIHKAKTIYMMESYQSIVESKKAVQEPQPASQGMDTADKVADSGSHEVLREAPNGGDQIVPGDNLSSCDYDDKENSPPVSDNVSSCALQYQQQSDSYLSAQTDSAKDSESSMEQQSCVRCVKRRMTEQDYCENQSSYCNIAGSPTKKGKFESETTEKDQQCQTEPMTPNKQICSLVNSFSSGFTGLLSGSLSSSCHEENTQEDSTYLSDSQTHSSENSLISCSTQIKEAFETLTRPIALAV